MSKRKYLLDEHVNPRLKRELVRREPDMIVWCIGDAGAPPLQTSDPEILRWCEANHFTLVTYNRSSMPVHLQRHLAEGRHIPGICLLNEGMTIGKIINELTLIWGAGTSDEFADKITHLPVT
jgi:hypothetical protein